MCEDRDVAYARNGARKRSGSTAREDAATKQLVYRPAPAQGAADASKLVRCHDEKCLTPVAYGWQGIR